MVRRLGKLLIFQTSVQPGSEVKGDQPTLLVLTGGHVLQHPHQDFTEGDARLTGAALRVLGSVEVAHFEVSLVFALGVALGIAAAWLWAITYPSTVASIILSHAPPQFINGSGAPWPTWAVGARTLRRSSCRAPKQILSSSGFSPDLLASLPSPGPEIIGHITLPVSRLFLARFRRGSGVGLIVSLVIHTPRRRRRRPACTGRQGVPGGPALYRGPGPPRR